MPGRVLRLHPRGHGGIVFLVVVKRRTSSPLTILTRRVPRCRSATAILTTASPWTTLKTWRANSDVFVTNRDSMLHSRNGLELSLQPVDRLAQLFVLQLQLLETLLLLAIDGAQFFFRLPLQVERRLVPHFLHLLNEIVVILPRKAGLRRIIRVLLLTTTNATTNSMDGVCGAYNRFSFCFFSCCLRKYCFLFNFRFFNTSAAVSTFGISGFASKSSDFAKDSGGRIGISPRRRQSAISFSIWDLNGVWNSGTEGDFGCHLILGEKDGIEKGSGFNDDGRDGRMRNGIMSPKQQQSLSALDSLDKCNLNVHYTQHSI